MSSDYKASKEAFVSGMTGSTVGHINLVSLVALATIALHSAFRSRLPPSRTTNFITEYFILVAPLLLSLTLFATTPLRLSLVLLFPTGLLLLIPRRESGTPLPSSSDYFLRPALSPLPSQEKKFGHSSPRGEDADKVVVIPPLPALTVYRAHMMLMTIISILAVDFPVFPRSLAKCETFGVSLMDIGVGSFVFSQGIISSIPLIKDPSRLTKPLLPKLTSTLRKVLPVLVLGLVRVALVKGTDYPEHVSEYGAHWNFFITLGLIPLFETFLHPLIVRLPIALLGILVALSHQIALSFMGLNQYVLNAPRTNVFSANKEGISSLPGYLAIHLLGLSAGTLLLPSSPNYFRRVQKTLSSQRHKPKRRDSNEGPGKRKTENEGVVQRENDRTAVELFSYAAIWWTGMGVTVWWGVGGGVSRRLVNLPYVLWIAAYNVSFILGYLLLDLFFFPSPLSRSTYSPTSKLKVHQDQSMTLMQAQDELQVPKAPALLEAVNRNGLVLFLLANLATGVVNLAMETMYASDGTSMAVLAGYSIGICAVAWVARGRKIWKF